MLAISGPPESPGQADRISRSRKRRRNATVRADHLGRDEPLPVLAAARPGEERRRVQLPALGLAEAEWVAATEARHRQGRAQAVVVASSRRWRGGSRGSWSDRRARSPPGYCGMGPELGCLLAPVTPITSPPVSPSPCVPRSRRARGGDRDAVGCRHDLCRSDHGSGTVEAAVLEDRHREAVVARLAGEPPITLGRALAAAAAAGAATYIPHTNHMPAPFFPAPPRSPRDSLSPGPLGKLPGKWRSTWSAIVSRTQRRVSESAMHSAPQHRLVFQRQAGDLPADREPLEHSPPTAPGVLGRGGAAGRGLADLLDRLGAELGAKGQDVALVVGVLDRRRRLAAAALLASWPRVSPPPRGAGAARPGPRRPRPRPPRSSCP